MRNVYAPSSPFLPPDLPTIKAGVFTVVSISPTPRSLESGLEVTDRGKTPFLLGFPNDSRPTQSLGETTTPGGPGNCSAPPWRVGGATLSLATMAITSEPGLVIRSSTVITR